MAHTRQKGTPKGTIPDTPGVPGYFGCRLPGTRDAPGGASGSTNIGHTRLYRASWHLYPIFASFWWENTRVFQDVFPHTLANLTYPSSRHAYIHPAYPGILELAYPTYAGVYQLGRTRIPRRQSSCPYPTVISDMYPTLATFACLRKSTVF